MSVARLAPGVVKGHNFGGGAGVSFGGSSVAENTIYINGLNVTDFYNRIGFSAVPYAFYDEFQVKTGGYSVEFGRTTGGVINAVTRKGTNEFEFGAEITLGAGFPAGPARPTSPEFSASTTSTTARTTTSTPPARSSRTSCSSSRCTSSATTTPSTPTTPASASMMRRRTTTSGARRSTG